MLTTVANVYRALHLLAATAREGAPAGAGSRGRPAVGAVGRPEQGGGTQGTVRRRPVRVELGVTGEDTGYALALGLPQPTGLTDPSSATRRSSRRRCGRARWRARQPCSPSDAARTCAPGATTAGRP
ncbi:hypothetical protein GCM10022262_07250 [Georgenia daeguensis]|uniref:Uncharacterized protein n=1 Tax=Georgenia daeguensis TaxID=908355 RepID=A0ABP8EQV3_9MICO